MVGWERKSLRIEFGIVVVNSSSFQGRHVLNLEWLEEEERRIRKPSKVSGGFVRLFVRLLVIEFYKRGMWLRRDGLRQGVRLFDADYLIAWFLAGLLASSTIIEFEGC